ncbi:hypothetical protein G6F23_014385 [Rhizopus arrhizus]|nr:hypothetical protein G6F23_014385 [Rhizopus arrhizus]
MRPYLVLGLLLLGTLAAVGYRFRHPKPDDTRRRIVSDLVAGGLMYAFIAPAVGGAAGPAADSAAAASRRRPNRAVAVHPRPGSLAGPGEDPGLGAAGGRRATAPQRPDRGQPGPAGPANGRPPAHLAAAAPAVSPRLACRATRCPCSGDMPRRWRSRSYAPRSTPNRRTPPCD